MIVFDINKKRIDQLTFNIDTSLETTKSELIEAKKLKFTSDYNLLKTCNCFIVAVPTPIDQKKKPDLSLLIDATKLVAGLLKKGGIVIYESTVYPGTTEEECIPIIEKHSGLKLNLDFFCGYSPERANPGDKIHKLTTIKKVTSGSNPEIADLIDKLYKDIIPAGTHKARSIKIAEAAKIIENTQRDLNIALMNELSIIFNKLNIETCEVLEAAKTKWNFLPFTPGLVGGHCIGVDPYYLTYKAKTVGYKPKLILSGRNLNDNMGSHVVSKLISKMKEKSIRLKNSRILIMGLAFKENCPDLRNTRVIDIYKKLQRKKCKIEVFDPWVSKDDAKKTYSIKLIKKPKNNFYDAIILAVGHKIFKDKFGPKIKLFVKEKHVLFDVKNLLPQYLSDLRL